MQININTQTSNEKTKDSRANVTRSTIKKAAEEIHERESKHWQAQKADVTIARNDRQDVTLDPDQINALSLFTTQQYACLSGPAGTGKTTIMKYALPLIEQQVRKIDFQHARSGGRYPNANQEKVPAIGMACATNVAAQNLASKLDTKWATHCMSIHSLLCFQPVLDPDTGRPTGIFEPLYNAGRKMPYEVVIIDEAGIMSLTLWRDFQEALRPETRVYLLGDLFQMEPVQGASPMPFAMDFWPTAYLNKIYRQKDGSPIITEAHNIRKGLFPKHHRGKFIMAENERLPKRLNEAAKHTLGYIRALYRAKLFDPAQDIIITPQNDGLLGQSTINSTFRLEFNPPKKDAKTGETLNPPILIRTAEGAIDFMVGDKVMATSNGGRTATERRFNNGSIGIITAIYPNPNYKGDTSILGQMHVNEGVQDEENDMNDMFDDFGGNTSIDAQSAENLFDAIIDDDDTEQTQETARRSASHILEVTEVSTGEKYILERSAEIANLKHAYAVTCHKFQGSQARRVMIVIHESCHPSMLSREYLYTAVTRAQEAVILLHDESSIMRCITRQTIYGRDAKEKAQNMVAKYKKQKAWRIPNLPKASNIVATPEILQQIKDLTK